MKIKNENKPKKTNGHVVAIESMVFELEYFFMFFFVNRWQKI